MQKLQMRLFPVLLFSFAAASSAADWHQWRGPTGIGISDSQRFPMEWSETKNVAWRTEIPGLGWSSPVIMGDQIWLTTAKTVKATEGEIAERKKSITNSQPVTIVSQIIMHALCIDRSSGQILRDIVLMKQDNPDPIHIDNSYATPTPWLEKGRIYCHFGTHGSACADTETGEVLWTNQEIRINHENGPGGSPVIVDDFMIFQCDGSDAQFVVALDKKTGEFAWKSDRSGELNSNPQLKKSYGTPLVVNRDGATQVISPGADWLYSYEPATGKELWRMPFGQLGFSNASRPVYGDGTLYLSTGYMKARFLAVPLDATAQQTSIEWEYNKQVANVSSPLLVDNRIYFISDRGVATCLNAKTGQEIWQKRVGGNHWSSPVYVSGHILFSSKEGETTIIRASDDFEIIARNQLDGVIMASVAAVENGLFIRTDKALYRIE